MKTPWFFITVLMLSSVGQVSSDLYLPSLPAISVDLKSSLDWVQFSISIYMYGYGCSQFIYGPLSEGIGRKKPLILGFIILLIGSFICINASSIFWLNTGRFIQGLGAGSGLSIARAILRDTYKGDLFAKFSSYFSIGVMSIMTGAPLLGGYLQHFLGWRANFIFLFFYTFSILLMIFYCLPETNLYKDQNRIQPHKVFAAFKNLIQHQNFIILNSIIFLTYGGFVGWMTAAPVILQSKMALQPIRFGWIIAIIGTVYAIGSVFNGLIVEKYGAKKMLYLGIIFLTIGSLLMLFLGINHIFNYYSIIGPIIIFIFGCSLIFPNAISTALSYFSTLTGFAVSLLGAIQILGGALFSTLIAYLPETNQIPLALLLSFISIFCVILFHLFKKSGELNK